MLADRQTYRQLDMHNILLLDGTSLYIFIYTYSLEKLDSINDLGVIFDSCLSFRHGHQRLAECVQTSAERGEDTAVIARLESARRQGRLPRRPGARHSRRYFGHRSRPRCCH